MRSDSSITKCNHVARIRLCMATNPDWSTQSARLRWARETSGLGSARQVAADRGWPSSTYITHENGSRLKKGLSEEDARKYARAFRVDLAWLMTGAGEPRRTAEPGEVVATIMGRVGAGARVMVEDHADAWPVVGIPLEIAETCELYEITGSSMLPLFHDGDVLAVERRYLTPQQLIGRMALVVLADGTRLIKTIKRGPDGLFNLTSLNFEDIDEVEIVSAGRIAWVKFAG
mgnify:CR=1 FL=1